MKRSSTRAGATGEQNKLTPSRARKERWKNRIVELYLQAYSTADIIETMLAETDHKFGAETINKYIKDANIQWVSNMNAMITNHKAIEVEKINKLEMEYWMAWKRSQRNQKSKSETKVPMVSPGQDPPATKKRSTGNNLQIAQIRTDDREAVGDPKFLDGIYRCVEMRNKLLGVEVAQNMIQINQNNVSSGSSSTTIVRRVVFKTRETTTEQIIEEENPDS